MRMKFLRIFPETCARTWCLFSNSTRNMAFGSGSRTTAITSIASSLLIDSLKGFWLLALGFQLKAKSQTLIAFLLRQNHWSVSGHCHTVLEVSAEAAVDRNGGPLVTKHSRVRLSVVHHGLDRKHHALAQFCAVPFGTEVRNLRLFVQPRADSVSYELAHHAESCRFDVLLNSRPNITDRVADSRLLNAAVERSFRHIQKLFQLRLQAIPDGNRDRRVAVVAVEHHTAVDRNDVALFQPALFRRDAVHNLFIHRRTQHAGIIVIALERRLGSQFLDLFFSGAFQVHRGSTRQHQSLDVIEDLAHDTSALTHLL